MWRDFHGSPVFKTPRGSVPGWETKILQAMQCSQKKGHVGTSPVVQWLRLRAPNAGGPGSIPGQGTRSRMHATTKS